MLRLLRPGPLNELRLGGVIKLKTGTTGRHPTMGRRTAYKKAKYVFWGCAARSPGTYTAPRRCARGGRPSLSIRKDLRDESIEYFANGHKATQFHLYAINTRTFLGAQTTPCVFIWVLAARARVIPVRITQSHHIEARVGWFLGIPPDRYGV